MAKTPEEMILELLPCKPTELFRQLSAGLTESQAKEALAHLMNWEDPKVILTPKRVLILAEPATPAPIAAQTEKCSVNRNDPMKWCYVHKQYDCHESKEVEWFTCGPAEQVDAARLVDQFRDAVLGMSSAEEYDRIREKLIASLKQETQPPRCISELVGVKGEKVLCERDFHEKGNHRGTVKGVMIEWVQYPARAASSSPLETPAAK